MWQDPVALAFRRALQKRMEIWLPFGFFLLFQLED